MMKQQFFTIDLKQPVIISQQAATAGAHQSLDYISGSSILGLVAGKIYNELSQEEAFTVFHSGNIRFLNALPTSNNEIGYPVPLSLHNFKGETYLEEKNILASQVFDVSNITDGELKNRQPVQLRNFYINSFGQKITPIKEQTLKTAIDKNHNRAANGQLFGYEALSKGQQLQFSVQADDDINEGLWQKIVQSLDGTAHLGRSRSSQFGKVEICKVDNKPNQKPKAEKILTLWLLSDMCLQDNNQITLLPQPAQLGLPDGTKWLSDKSFVRTRRYSIFNNYRKHYDKERQVIVQGSVLRYQLPDNVNFDEVVKTLEQGIGLYTEQGLGQVLINPEILQQTYPTWINNSTKQQVGQVTEIVEPKTQLVQTLTRRVNAIAFGVKPKQLANEIFVQLGGKINSARRFHGVRYASNFESVGQQAPSRTQFGGLKELANRFRNDSSKLWHELANETNGFLYVKNVRETDNRQSGKLYKNSGWDLTFDTQDNQNLGTFLLKQLSNYKQESYFPQIIGELAVLGMSNEWEKVCLGLNKEDAEGADK